MIDDELGWLIKKILTGVLMSFFSLIAVFGNASVIIVMIKEKKLRTASFYFFDKYHLVNH